MTEQQARDLAARLGEGGASADARRGPLGVWYVRQWGGRYATKIHFVYFSPGQHRYDALAWALCKEAATA